MPETKDGGWVLDESGGFADILKPRASKAFCPTGEGGGIDPTCSPGGPKIDPALRTRTEEGIRRAVAERPGRATHGHTATNAFAITPEGKVIPWNELRMGPNAPAEQRDLVDVHSHSAENWEELHGQPGQPPEDFQPLNAVDVHGWLKMVADGKSKASAIIVADGRMEMLAVTDKLDPAVFRLGRKKLEGLLYKKYGERAKYWEEHKNDPDYEPYKQERELLREFSRKYGIEYSEGLRWKKKGE